MSELHDISEAGWEGVNSHQAELPQYSATDQAKIDRAVAVMFDTQQGQEVLAWLESSFLNQPTWAPGFATDYGFFREGQNTLIRELLARRDRAKER